MFTRGSDHPLWTRPRPPGRRWRRSSYCDTSADCYSSNCVEVSVERDAVRLRDSADAAGTVLAFPTTAWAAFVGAVRDGAFGD